MPDSAKALRRLNTTKNRTDVENLFLKEMVIEDQDMLINEADEIAMDVIIPDEVDNNDSLFGDSSSEDLDDLVDDVDSDELSIVDF